MMNGTSTPSSVRGFNTGRNSNSVTEVGTARNKTSNTPSNVALVQHKAEADKDNDAELENFFSTRKPRDGWAGLSSGLKNVAKGTMAGVTGLIAAPIVGAQQDGVRGFVTGLATGVVSAVVFPVGGLAVGAYQIGRGLVNSGEAVRAAQAGMMWDEDKREWYFYLIDKEMQEILQEHEKLAANGGKGVGTSRPERSVKDREYYDLLGVSTNVTSADLKKAYYKRSREVHPDRNPNDKEAGMKFQALSHAYQVLANDQSRSFYDKNGKTESNAAEMQLSDIDPYLFFAIMFGSESVRPYIGELWIASKADSLMKDCSNLSDLTAAVGGADDNPGKAFDQDSAYSEASAKLSTEDTLKQRRREVECAMFLRERIMPYVDCSSDEAEFVAIAQAEAANITKGSFGDIYCTAIGAALEMEASDFIGTHASFLGMEGQAARFKKRSYNFNNQLKVLGSGITAARAGQQIYKEMENLHRDAQDLSLGEDQSKDESATENGVKATVVAEERFKQATEKMEASLPAFLEFAWALNVNDITRTLRHACRRLFHDAAELLPLEVRLRRAEGLRLLGREFHSMGKLAKKTNFKNIDAQEFRTRAEVAAMTTFARAQGQDVSSKDTEELIRRAKAMEAARASGTTPPDP